MGDACSSCVARDNDALEKAVATAKTLPPFAAVQSQLELKRLGGLTNLVFKVSAADLPKPLLLRLPGEGTEEFINRKVEKTCAEETGRVDVSAKVLYFDADTGIMVAEFIDGTTTMTPDGFRNTAGAPARAGTALAKLHSSGIVLDFTFDVFKMIDEYLRILGEKEGVSFPDGYADALKKAEGLRVALAAHPLPAKPCHCDTLAENFLDNGAKMWIVDWEYCGMNDPLWDLGNLASEADFSVQMEDELLCGYFGTNDQTPYEKGRYFSYKVLCNLLWTLWGLIQVANKNPADDFGEFARTHFEKCKAFMAASEFVTHVEAVLQGPKC